MKFLDAISVLSAMTTLYFHVHHLNIHSTYTREDKLRGIEMQTGLVSTNDFLWLNCVCGETTMMNTHHHQHQHQHQDEWCLRHVASQASSIFLVLFLFFFTNNYYLQVLHATKMTMNAHQQHQH